MTRNRSTRRYFVWGEIEITFRESDFSINYIHLRATLRRYRCRNRMIALQVFDPLPTTPVPSVNFSSLLAICVNSGTPLLHRTTSNSFTFRVILYKDGYDVMSIQIEKYLTMVSKRQKILAPLLFLLIFLFLRPANDVKISQKTIIQEIKAMEQSLRKRDQDIVFDEINADSARREEDDGQFPFQISHRRASLLRRDLLVLNMMPVSVGDAEARARVRRMWGAREVVASTRLRPLFLVGESRDAEQQRRLQDESDEYHDVIQVGFVDSYLNLTLKTLSALHWKHTRCRHVPWLLKSDADVFMNPWSVSETLQKATEDIVCRVLYARIVCRPHTCKDKRWIIPPELYPHDHYPPYCNGPVYAVNQNFIQTVLPAASAKNPFPMEDAYFTGILVQGTGLRYKDIAKRCQLYHLREPSPQTIAT
ncbi:lactosylceramide 1,3-N-acetyl-beta-D-glucosaminyltransferase-like, partial [Penaeus monodon]|uniref:lactosylceramide 1,3-N-acetyl-beta-D-glucosaminyltransferase-like n=1 Tax=Penaeus monodon TaxID=6687 RepID=UPI0018A7A95A